MKTFPIIFLFLPTLIAETKAPLEMTLHRDVSQHEVASVQNSEKSDTTTKDDQLNLREALNLALQHHPDFRVNRLEPLVAKEGVVVSEGNRVPEFYSSIGLEKEEASQVNRGTGSQFQVNNDNLNGELGIRGQWDATSYDLGATFTRDTSSRTPEQQELRVGLSVEQALLQGRKASRPWLEVQRANLDWEGSRHALEHLAEIVLADVEAAYWTAVYEKKSLEVMDASLKAARLAEKDALASVEVGRLSPSDAWTAKAEVAFWASQKISQESSLEQAILDLQYLTGWTGEKLAESLPDDLQKPEDRVPDFSNRSDLAEARTLLKKGLLELKATQDGLLPQLDLVFDLGKSGYGDRENKLGRRISDEDFDMRVGLEFAIPLGRKEANSRHQINHLEREKAQRAIDTLERLALRDWRQSKSKIQSGLKRLPLLHQRTNLTKKSFQAERVRLKEGESTALEVARLHREHVDTLLDLENLKLNLAMARLDLKLAQGRLLEHWEIELKHPK